MNRSLLTALAVALLAALPALAQTPDPLDPRGYFPLAVGNEWEYRVDLTRPASPGVPNTSRTEYLRYRVTAAAGDAFTLATTRYSDAFAVISRETASVRFDAATTSVRTVLAGGGLGAPTPFFACDLGLSFDDPTPGETLCYRGATQGEAQIPDLTGTSEPVTTKQFFGFVYTFTAVHGLGFIGGGGGCDPCGPFSDRDDYTLTYARVGGQTYGNQVVASAPGPSAAAGALMVYPNPTSGVVTLRTGAGTSPEALDVRVYDALGRLVLASTVSAGSSVQVDLGPLPRGSYAVQIRGQSMRVVVR